MNSDPLGAMAKKKNPKKDLEAIERTAKRQEQKEAGALDGRFREKVVPDKKRKAKIPPKKAIDPEEEL